jgi:FAD/FMN-containing dehydrogenase
MLRVRAAFDPSGLCNPGKIIPMPKWCGEARAVATVDMAEPGAIGTESLHPTRPSDPVAIAPGTDTKGLARGNFVPHPSPLPKGEANRLGSANLVAARVNETRVARDLSHLLGDVGVRRLTDVSIELRDDKRAERLIEVAPSSAEQASDVMQFAAAEGLAVIPAGSRNFIEAGNLLTQADLILSTRQMNRFVGHEPADLVATAEAGMTLNEFQKRLAETGQWLPIDPPDDSSATIGGVVASGAGGPQSIGYGSLRSFVIGLRAVLADGRQIKAGGNVVKNVAGYDLCKLFTGSYGTLALITQVTFKLRPLPAEARTIVALGPRATSLTAGRRVATDFLPVALEIVSPDLAGELGLGLSPKADDCVLLVRFAGSARAVITQTAQALKTLRDEGMRCATYDDEPSIWKTLARVSSESQHDLSWRTRVRATDLPAVVEEVVALERDDAWRSTVRWHAGIGDGCLRAVARSPVYHQEAVRTLEQLRQSAEDRGGSLVMEKAPVEVKRDFDSWGSFGSAGDLMKRVKRQLDPQNLLSPGRMFT